MKDGGSLVPQCQPSTRFNCGLTLAPIWRSGFEFISEPFCRQLRDSFWSSFEAPKASRKVTRRHRKPRDSYPNLESFRCTQNFLRLDLLMTPRSRNSKKQALCVGPQPSYPPPCGVGGCNFFTIIYGLNQCLGKKQSSSSTLETQ